VKLSICLSASVTMLKSKEKICFRSKKLSFKFSSNPIDKGKLFQKMCFVYNQLPFWT
jgi:hypothetical protein